MSATGTGTIRDVASPDPGTAGGSAADGVAAMREHCRRLEARLVETEKEAALARLIAGVSHEVNTPIGILLGAATQFAEEARLIAEKADQGTLKRRDFTEFLGVTDDIVRLMVHNAKRAAELAGAFKQVVADRSRVDARQVDLLDYMREVLAMLDPLFRRRAIGLSVTGRQGLEVVTVPGLLAQVVTNLVQNAVLHAFDGVADRRISVDVGLEPEDGDQGAEGASWARITVADTGTGMTAEVRDRAFDPFFTTKRDQGGTGLGLHIVADLVTGPLGGRITLDTAPGQGARFTILLPAGGLAGTAAG